MFGSTNLAASRSGQHRLPHLLGQAIRGFGSRLGGPLPAGDPREIMAKARDALGPPGLPKAGMGAELGLSKVSRLLGRFGIDLSHPRAAAHLQPPTLSVAVVADLIASLTNASVDTFDSGPASIAIERWVIDSLAMEAGLPSQTSGVMCPGGSMSNLLGLMLARDQSAYRLGQDVRTHGVGVLEQPVVLCSELAHFSINRACAALGMGESAVRPIAVDSEQRMDVVALRKELSRLSADHTIVAVVATAGTTDFGSVDPIHAIADLCSKFDVWLHVDAAYGFGAIFSDKLKVMLDGIERADSITLDLHKLGWQPAATSTLLVTDPEAFRSLERYPEYLSADDDVSAGYAGTLGMTLQTTRRADAVKVAASIFALGRSGLGQLVDTCHTLAVSAAERVQQTDELELLACPKLSTVLFRYCSENSDSVNAEIRRRLLESGYAIVGRTTFKGRVCLKLTFLNPETKLRDIDDIIGAIVRAGRQSSIQRAGLHRVGA